MMDDAPISALLECLRQHPHFVVTSHARPDGDAVGSVLALAELLEQLGRTVDVVLADPIPVIYRTLPGVDRIRRAASLESTLPSAPVIILECDCTDRTGLGGLDHRLLINIDHHASGRNYAALNWIDPDACAVAAMVYRLALAAEVHITPTMATCFYTAILSDTGTFTYPGTSSETFAIAHQLTLKGANPALIARDVYFSNPLSKIRLLGAALSNLQYSDSLAWTWVTRQDLALSRADAEDCEGVINHLIAIDGAEAAAFLRETPSGQFRLSIRSKGRINVARVAEALGGGGHRSASGCTLNGPLTHAVESVLHQLRTQL
ncbi:MAG TPA: bifunctional oligoribonuclease/PAP phosphatase NrnA [Granulicella sp.]|nr:bifunctional oligoribonuclease/PAP phosphatase NrnA [Granulicella sp.]